MNLIDLARLSKKKKKDFARDKISQLICIKCLMCMKSTLKQQMIYSKIFLHFYCFVTETSLRGKHEFQLAQLIKFLIVE